MMAITSHEIVGRALTLVRDVVRPYAEQIWLSRFGARWRDRVNSRLPHRDRHANPDDLAFLLKGMDATWDDCFRSTLSRTTRSYLHLLWDARNRWAHNERFSLEEAFRILDHGEMMLRDLGADESAAQVQELKQGLQRLRFRRDEKLKEAIPEAWRRMLDGPDEGLIDLVVQRVHEKAELEPTRREVANILAPFLAEHAHHLPDPQPHGFKPPVSGTHPSGPGFEGKPSEVRLWDKSQSVTSWIRVLLFVLEALHDRHGADAFERVLVRLVTRDRGSLKRSVEVGATGFWINRSIPITEIRRRSYACLQDFGHPATDLEIVCN